MLDWVLSKCISSATYFDRVAKRNSFSSPLHFIQARVSILIPFGDPLRDQYFGKIDIVEGPEHDVLTRYVKMADLHDSDYIVRITSDCPLIPPWLISKHITTAVMSGLDYLSNVDERCRTAPDGFDCEVISKRLLDYTHIAAKEPSEREHVTTWIRANFPDWAERGFTINHADQSSIKWSVDNEEDLARVRDEFYRLEEKKIVAEKIYGEKRVFRL